MTSTEKLQQEAESLYQSDPEKNYLYNQAQVVGAQRAAHVACAEKYTAIIEQKDKEIERLRQALDLSTEENNKISAENHIQSEELGELKDINISIERKVIQEQQHLLIAYRNKIALSPDIRAETILEMLEDDIKTLRTKMGGEIVKNIIGSNNNKS